MFKIINEVYEISWKDENQKRRSTIVYDKLTARSLYDNLIEEGRTAILSTTIKQPDWIENNHKSERKFNA